MQNLIYRNAPLQFSYDVAIRYSSRHEKDVNYLVCIVNNIMFKINLYLRIMLKMVCKKRKIFLLLTNKKL